MLYFTDTPPILMLLGSILCEYQWEVLFIVLFLIPIIYTLEIRNTYLQVGFLNLLLGFVFLIRLNPETNRVKLILSYKVCYYKCNNRN